MVTTTNTVDVITISIKGSVPESAGLVFVDYLERYPALKMSNECGFLKIEVPTEISWEFMGDICTSDPGRVIGEVRNGWPSTIEFKV